MKYRNVVFIEADNGEMIEPDSLWERREDMMILVDDDQHVTSDFIEERFIIESD